MRFYSHLRSKLVFGSAIAAFLTIFIAQPAFAGSIVGWGDQVVVGDLSSGFTKVAAGGRHSLGLRQDGSIVAWGNNGYGECNVFLPNADFNAIAAGGHHSLGLKQNGSIVAWGNNTYGECNIPYPNTGFAAVAAGSYHSLGLKQDSIVAWGRNDSGECNVPWPDANFVAVTAGEKHSIGLKQNGTIVTWGDNTYGQCNIPTPNTDFIAIAAGSYHSLGLKQDGSIVAWGRNDSGECNVPPDTNFVAVAGGDHHSLGLKQDGSIAAWGNNTYGQCNVPEPNTGFVAVAAGYEHSIGIKQDGSIVGWGRNNKSQCNVPLPNADFIVVAASGHHNLGLRLEGTIAAWGDNTYGECNVPLPNADFIDIDAGEYHSMGIKRDGSIAAWGRNDYNQCDVPSPNIDFVAIAAGYYHSIGLKQDGNVVAWGRNDYGQCYVPWPDANFVAIAAGGYHGLVLKQDGSIVAWGRNDYGQCYVPWPDANFAAVAAGGYHSVGLKQDGSIVAWGRNDYNQCNVPTPNTDFVAVAAGSYHSIGLKQDGSIVAWGRNNYGQCNPPSPNTGFVAVTAGLSRGLALTGTHGAATGSLSGVVYDFDTGKPISGATISIAGGLSVKTDQDGKFNFNRVPAGDIVITAAKAAYFSTTTTSSTDPGVVPTRYNGFGQRMRIAVAQIEGKYFSESRRCNFLEGISCPETITVTIYWGDNSPGCVKWYLPNGTIEEDDVRNYANPGTVSRTFDMGSIGRGSLSVDVLDSDGKSILPLPEDFRPAGALKRKWANLRVVEPPPGIPDGVLTPKPQGNILKYISTDYVVSFIDEGVGAGVIPGNIPFFGGDSFLCKLIGPISAIVNGDGTVTATVYSGTPWAPIEAAGTGITPTVYVDLFWKYKGGKWRPGGTIGFSVDGKFPYTLYYVPFYFRVSFEFGLGATINIILWDPAPILSGNVVFQVLTEVAGGVGIPCVPRLFDAELFLGGGARMTLRFPDEPHMEFCIRIDGGVRLIALWIFEKEWDPIHHEWCFDVGARGTDAAMAALSLTPADIGKFEIMGRDYLGENYAIWIPAVPQEERLTTLDGEEQMPPEPNEEQLLQFNVFDYSQPSISADGNDLLLAWIYDDPNRDPCEPNSVNRTEVVFARCVDTNWIEPEPIDDDGTADFSPEIIALADGNALCVWENVKELLPSDVNLTEMAAAMEIKAAHYDSVSGAWSAQALTDNNHLDRTPRIAAADNGTAVAVWVHNEKDDVLGEDANAPDEIRYSFWDGSTWSEPNTVAAGIGLILKPDLAYDGNEAVYVYSLDADCNWATEADQELYAITYNDSNWSLPYRITDDNLLDINPQVIYDQNDIVLVWSRDVNIVSCRNLDINSVQQILNTSGSSAAMDFRLAKSPVGQMSLLWAETSDEGTDIFTATYDPNLYIWSKPYQLTSGREMERSMSATYTGASELAVAYNKVEIIDNNDVPEPNRVDLYILRHPISGDLAIASGDISLSVPNPTPGSTVDINAVIHNAGDVGEVDVTVAFYNGDPSASGVLIGSQTIPGPIRAGDTAVACVVWFVPEVNEPQQIYVVIDPNFERQDADRNNNVASIQVLAADLTVSHIISERIGPKIRAITARIANTGVLPAEDIAVTIRRDSATGPEIANLDVNRIGPNSSYDVWHLWNIAAEEFNDVEIEIYVTVDEPDSISESDEDNNMSFSVVNVGKIADVTDNGTVGFADLCKFASQWLKNCTAPDWCEYGDFNRSGKVDFIDFAVLAEDWLWQAGWYTGD